MKIELLVLPRTIFNFTLARAFWPLVSLLILSPLPKPQLTSGKRQIPDELLSVLCPDPSKAVSANQFNDWVKEWEEWLRLHGMSAEAEMLKAGIKRPQLESTAAIKQMLLGHGVSESAVEQTADQLLFYLFHHQDAIENEINSLNAQVAQQRRQLSQIMGLDQDNIFSDIASVDSAQTDELPLLRLKVWAQNILKLNPQPHCLLTDSPICARVLRDYTKSPEIADLPWPIMNSTLDQSQWTELAFSAFNDSGLLTIRKNWNNLWAQPSRADHGPNSLKSMLEQAAETLAEAWRKMGLTLENSGRLHCYEAPGYDFRTLLSAMQTEFSPASASGKESWPWFWLQAEGTEE